MRRVRELLADERGSAVVEFSLVSVVLVALVLAVLQLALALHIRNTVLDAAAEGARYAALADNSLDDGVQRTRDLITTALGPAYASDVSAEYATYAGLPSTEVRVRSPLPLAGLLGPDRALEVTGHAARESLDGG
ncbi:TadE/TadG family type IV pilus assembly protein [Glaciibacter flavus]|uniref:TadE/TadG family type IV pilus assembly protein n=1 Tax=Orlajensenia flava TaxID=2565934 RepID=UPI003AFFD812